MIRWLLTLVLIVFDCISLRSDVGVSLMLIVLIVFFCLFLWFACCGWFDGVYCLIYCLICLDIMLGII